MSAYLLVALGGAIGSVARYGAYVALAGASGFPWGTLAVNYIGSFVIGIIAAAEPTPDARLFLMTGICGGFTTFSAFSLDTVSLMREGQMSKALAYVGASLVGCLAATYLGFRTRA
jgi:CrcB protein